MTTNLLARSLVVALLGLALASCGGGGSDATDTTQSPFSVAVIGDSPYSIAYRETAQYQAYPAFISAINQDTSVELAIHVGDIHSGKDYCTESYNLDVFNLWKSFNIPLIYTPGDNEWADCHKVKQGGGLYNATTGDIDYVSTDGGGYARGDPPANLNLIRSIFFPLPGKSLGSKPIETHTQALEYDSAHPADAQFIENTWVEKNGVFFISINLPGESNNDTDIWYGTPSMSNAQANEVATRTGANVRWINQAFSQAIANKAIAVVVVTQADLWNQSFWTKAHLTEYKQFIDAIAAQTVAFGKPVLLINGDSHIYRSDNPLMPGATCVTELPATARVGAALVPATAAVACSDASVASVMEEYHYDVYGTPDATTDPYANQPGGYNVPNFHRIVAHTNAANPLEYLRLTINPAANAPNGSTAFGPFSWSRIQP